MDNLSWIIAADIAAVLGIVIVALRFLTAQAQRITKTEHRLQALETAMSESKQKQETTDTTMESINVRLAVLESKVESLVEGQREIIALLRQQHKG